VPSACVTGIDCDLASASRVRPGWRKAPASRRSRCHAGSGVATDLAAQTGLPIDATRAP